MTTPINGAVACLGYSVYAAETFNNGADINHPRVYLDDGFYSMEPVFGRLLTEAKQHGYRFVGYEMTDSQGMSDLNAMPWTERVTRREIAQTENLMAGIFRDNPNTKTIIHVGHRHVQERAKLGEVEWMAQRLAVATGRDPLTITQTACQSGSGVTALATGPDNAMDLYIAHGPLSLKDGRPAWRQSAGDIAVQPPATSLITDGPFVIEARPIDAPIDTVPIDRLLLRPGESLPLLLPPGRYRIDTTSSTGESAPRPVALTVQKQ